MKSLSLHLRNYYHWLHGQWPAGKVEKLPEVGFEGSTNIPGVWVVGDLAGPALLKFAAQGGSRAVRALVDSARFRAHQKSDNLHDVVIVGAGVSGVAAAIEAKKRGLRYVLVEANARFSTLKNFPAKKPIFTYPPEMEVDSDLLVVGDIKESLIENFERQFQEAELEVTQATVDRIDAGEVLEVCLASGEVLHAKGVIIALGRSGKFRRLGVEGEDLDGVSNRLHDPSIHRGQSVLVVGGGDSAVESALALHRGGANVSLSYRKQELVRPKAENLAALMQLVNTNEIKLKLGTTVESISPLETSLLSLDGSQESVPTSALYLMIGREAPLDFFRRSGLKIQGEWQSRSKWGLAGFLVFCFWLYHWKSYGVTTEFINPGSWMNALGDLLGERAQARDSFLYTILKSASGPSFYYTLMYSLAVLVFGVRRIKRRGTDYVRVQTITLMFVQWLPLFILPEIILPWMGRNEWFVEGAALRPLADLFFEPYDGAVGIERAWWRSYGFVLAWPLMVYNWFTDQPMWGWIVVGGLQTFVLIPLMIRRWGKGAMCGWLCSCGALAETLGDMQRHKMPHGPKWNRLNIIGQVILGLASLLMVIRVLGWIFPGSWFDNVFYSLLAGNSPLTYKWLVDVFLGGVLGVGLYFHFSGRMWCRFACPLAALMNIYGRFSKFRIFSDKAKCISCNACTSVCHQGIDVMAFANKGLAMEDPQCVRCSACIGTCPTGTLSFGRLGKNDEVVLDKLNASLIQIGKMGPKP